MTAKAFIKLLTPPLFVRFIQLFRSPEPEEKLNLSGDYRSWTEAMQDSTGYDAPLILEKTKAALLKVKAGEAVYERDSVLFDEVQYAWPMLAGLMWVAAQSNGRLNVLDFGGSLGSTYFQNRFFLRDLSFVRWNIVEQQSHVEAGKAVFEDEHLKFYPHIKDCLSETEPNLVIVSGTLQCLERPYDILADLSETPCRHMIIDRTPFWDGPKDRLCVQKVPASIYQASYPSWILSKQQFFFTLKKQGWDIIAEFESLGRFEGPVDFSHRGVITARRFFQEQKSEQT
jgi:putative methyltransferase (TIGR04325 family)